MTNIIRPGTTAVCRFNIPFAFNDIAAARVTFSQHTHPNCYESKPMLVKNLKDCDGAGTTLLLPLSQEDTLKFYSVYGPVGVQLHVRLNDGTAVKSYIEYASVDDILKREVV